MSSMDITGMSHTLASVFQIGIPSGSISMCHYDYFCLQVSQYLSSEYCYYCLGQCTLGKKHFEYEHLSLILFFFVLVDEKKGLTK